MRRFLLASVFCAVSQAAFANPVTVSSSNLFVHGSQNVSLSFNQGGATPFTLGASAGEFSVTIGNVDTFVYCVDIFHTLQIPSQYEIGTLTDLLGTTSTGLTKAAQVTFLLKNADVTTPTKSAATQLAVWEVIYEAGVTGYGLDTGNFTEVGTDAAARLVANGLVAGLNSFSLNSGDTTNLLTPADGSTSQKLAYFVGGGDGTVTIDVPEPASIAVLGLGLLGLGAFRRRMG